jgi:UPF0755 protein
MAIKRSIGKKHSKKSRFHRIIILTLVFLILISLIVAWIFFNTLFRAEVRIGGGGTLSLYIPTGSTFEDVKLILDDKNILQKKYSFYWLAHKKHYDSHVKPGRYILKDGMNNLELVNLLNSGLQTPVEVVFNNVRDRYQLAGRISTQIEADSASIAHLLDDPAYLSRFGVNKLNATILFLPNTYEFWWNTGAEQFVERMYKEYQAFWNSERRAKAAALHINIPQVVILASIVEKETNKNDEKPAIAGVYVNRLRRGWPLQADPTLVYASGDNGMQRILNVHKEIDSPYNTYKHAGLPPGPICIPSIASIDAVLNYKQDKDMFFCARADLSGYHVFAETLNEHQHNAVAYQRALDKMKIMK